MTTFRSLAEVVLTVDDMERALAFYRDTLGLPLFSPPELPGKFLQVGEHGGPGGATGVPQQIVLVPRPESKRRAGADRSERVLHHIGLEVDTNAYDALREKLAAAGHEIRAGEHPFLAVDAFYVDDPDGNEVEIVRHVASDPPAGC
jgi:catechol 2,3-dioxygenase-like lactoylglutathione lyase family enzyme